MNSRTQLAEVDGPCHSISYETIYLYVWADKAAGGELWRHMRQAVRKRRKRYGSRLIRQYLPKRQSMAHVTQQDCEAIAAKLNSRPRKRLGYRTPEEC